MAVSFIVARFLRRAAQGGMTDKAAEDGGAAEQKDAYGAVQSSATDEARESGEAVKQKRANGKEAANEKAASEKSADESTSSSLLQKAREFFIGRRVQEGREDEPISAQRRWIEQCLKLGSKDAGLSLSIFVKIERFRAFRG